MSAISTVPIPVFRVALPLIGGLSGLGLWLWLELWPTGVIAQRHLLGGGVALAALSFWLLSFLGAPRAAFAGLCAASWALFLGVLVWWAAGRHADAESFIALHYPLVSAGLVVLILTPLLAAEAEQAGGWRDYPLLFESGWAILQRHVWAAFFAAILWMLLLMTDTMFRLSGGALLDPLAQGDALPWILTGMAYGLSLVLAHNMREDVSPFLLLELLRFFMPLVLVISLTVLCLVPFYGLDQAFEALSPMQVLSAVCLLVVLSVTAAVARDRQSEVQEPWLRLCTALLALVLPGLAGLLAWSILLRVAQYGWTPDRLMAATTAAVFVIFGLSYALSVVLRGNWMGRIREVNLGLLIASLFVAVIWLTPLVVPERIAAMSQAMRALRGERGADLPLQELAQEWGRDGQQVLGQIERLRPDLTHAVGLVRAPGPNPSELPNPDRQALAQLMPILPKQTLPSQAWDGLSAAEAQAWLSACEYKLDGFPGCALILPDMGQTDQGGLVLLRDPGGVVLVRPVRLEGQTLRQSGRMIDPEDPGPVSLSVLDLLAVQSGAVEFTTPETKMIRLNGRSIFVHN